MASRARAVISAPHQVIEASTILSEPDFRLDARFWQEEFRAAKSLVRDGPHPVRPLGGPDGLANVWFPARFKRIYATDPRFGVPFLRAHATFYTIPESDRLLSTLNRDFDSCVIERGWILLARSGTIGAVAYVTDHLAEFVVTDDLVRIVPHDEDEGLYAAAYLQTRLGQTLVTHDEHGSAVPHISEKQAARVPVAFLEGDTRQQVVDLVRSAVEDRERHTRTLKEARSQFLDVCGLPAVDLLAPEYVPADGRPDIRAWHLLENLVSADRLDAEFFSPLNRLAQAEVVKSGTAAALDQAATLHLPSRYKRYYVEPPYGTPILGGRHIHQWRPVGIQRISDRSFSNPSEYTLTQGSVVFAADGRATEKLGEPAYVTSLWDGWMGSNHLMRVVPRDGVNPGLLYLALASAYVQVQLRSAATGSVVDALTPEIVGDVKIPLPTGREADELGTTCVNAMEGLAAARRREDQAIEIVALELEAG